MFGFRLSVKNVAAVLLAAIMASGAGAAQAQSTHRTRRESNANRKARIARTIQETYSHRWEVGGGGGYLRFRSGENLQRNNQITWDTWGQYNLSPKLGIVRQRQRPVWQRQDLQLLLSQQHLPPVHSAVQRPWAAWPIASMRKKSSQPARRFLAERLSVCSRATSTPSSRSRSACGPAKPAQRSP